jgi:protein-S-isoprenylcysteine O-methyltransferase Ste14
VARLRVPLGFVFGLLAVWLAAPTWRSLAWGAAIGLAGEALRIWAAGHLEKGREVTSSGPYRWMRHPLYVGSTLMGLGLAIASAHMAVVALVAFYLLVFMTAAIRSEDLWLAKRFGGTYERYRGGAVSDRRFSVRRALANREYRAVVGLALTLVVLAWKAW